MNFNLDMNINNVVFRFNCDLFDFENDIEKLIPLKEVRVADIDNLLESYSLLYDDLPLYLKQKIDEINLVD